MNHHLPRSKCLWTCLSERNIPAGVWKQQSINKLKPISSNIDCLISIFSRHDIVWHYSPSIHSVLWKQTHGTVDETSEVRRPCFSDTLVTTAAWVTATNFNLTPLVLFSFSLFFGLVTSTTENKKFSSLSFNSFPPEPAVHGQTLKAKEGYSYPPMRWLLTYLQGCQTVPGLKKTEVLV